MKTARTIILRPEDGQILVTYSNELGKDNTINIAMTDIDNSILTPFNSAIATKLSVLPQAIAKVSFVKLLDGVFTIIGEHYDPKTVNSADLVGAQKQVYDNLCAFVLAAVGQPLSSITAKYGSGRIIINGVDMDFVSVNAGAGTVLSDSTQLSIDLFNEQ